MKFQWGGEGIYCISLFNTSTSESVFSYFHKFSDWILENTWNQCAQNSCLYVKCKMQMTALVANLVELKEQLFIACGSLVTNKWMYRLLLWYVILTAKRTVITFIVQSNWLQLQNWFSTNISKAHWTFFTPSCVIHTTKSIARVDKFGHGLGPELLFVFLVIHSLT